MSQWPTNPDGLLTGNIAADVQIKAAIDALQAKLQRFITAQPTAFPIAGAHVTVDMSLGSQLAILMPAGNVTIDNPINSQDGDWLTLFVVQDAIGLRTVTWGVNYRKSVITLSIGANAIDAITFRYSASVVKWNQIAAPVLGIA